MFHEIFDCFRQEGCFVIKEFLFEQIEDNERRDGDGESPECCDQSLIDAAAELGNGMLVGHGKDVERVHHTQNCAEQTEQRGDGVNDRELVVL